RRARTAWRARAPREWAALARSQPPPMRELIDRDGEDHEDARDEVLVDHLDPDQRQAVAEDADDDRPDQRPDYCAAPAEQAPAAQHHRRRRVAGVARARRER